MSKPCNPQKPPATPFTCTKKVTITVDRPGGGTGLGQHCAISSTGQRLESRGSLQMWVREFFCMTGGLGRSLCLREGKKGSIRDVGDAGHDAEHSSWGTISNTLNRPRSGIHPTVLNRPQSANLRGHRGAWRRIPAVTVNPPQLCLFSASWMRWWHGVFLVL